MSSILVLVFSLVWSAAAQTTPPSPTTSETTPTAPPLTEQEKKKQKEAAEEGQVLNKVVVTGSYIRQAISNKAPTPLSTTDQSRMQETGSYTVANALRENVAFSADNSTVALHGQGAADNLVLLNGMRLPKEAGGEAVTIDFLPATAIERVEVLKDGASALYGSEALSGVVNIITKKDYDGINAFVRHSHPQLNVDQDTMVGLTYGKNFGERTNILAVVQMRKEFPAYYRDTPFGIQNVKIAGAIQGYPGNLLDNDTGAAFRDPACPAANIDGRGFCRYDFLRERYRSSDINSVSSLLGVKHEVSKYFQIEFANIYTFQNATNRSNPMPLNFQDDTATSGKNYSIPTAIANNWGTVGVNGAPGNAFATNPTLLYSPLGELGPRISDFESHNLVSQVRMSGQMLPEWDWEFSTSYGLSANKSTVVSGEANKDAVMNLINTNAFNPFKPIGAKDDLSSTFIQPWTRNSSDIWNSKAIFTGPLTRLNGRPLSVALGGEGQWQSFRFSNDPYSLQNLTLAGAATNQHGSRNVRSAFLEFGHSPFESLDVQLAGRFDEYSDVGSTVNPKLGMSYHLNKQLTFRASYGTGFKAPDMLAVFQGTSTSPSSVRDETVCVVNPDSQYCNNGIYPVTTSGNRNLKPETASHYNAGVVLTPQPKLAMSLDFWSVDGQDGLSEVDPDFVTRAEQLGLGSYLASQGIIVTRATTGEKQILNMQLPVRVNSATFKLRGIDFKIEKQLDLNTRWFGAYTVRLEMEHSHILFGGSNNFAIDPFRRNTDLRYKNFISASFARGNHFTKFLARTYPGHDRDGGVTGLYRGMTPTFTEYDVHHEWFVSESSSVSLGVKNVFNRVPKNFIRGQLLQAESQGYPLGRTFYVGYSHDF